MITQKKQNNNTQERYQFNSCRDIDDLIIPQSEWTRHKTSHIQLKEVASHAPSLDDYLHRKNDR